MVNFAALTATAQRLIEENGRQITLVKLAGAPVSSTPWDGPSDPEGSPASTAIMYAAFVQPDSTIRLGISATRMELWKTSEQIAIVSPGDVDISEYESLRDGTVTWKIENVEILKPSTTTVLGFIGVSR